MHVHATRHWLALVQYSQPARAAQTAGEGLPAGHASKVLCGGQIEHESIVSEVGNGVGDGVGNPSGDGVGNGVVAGVVGAAVVGAAAVGAAVHVGSTSAHVWGQFCIRRAVCSAVNQMRARMAQMLPDDHWAHPQIELSWATV